MKYIVFFTTLAVTVMLTCATKGVYKCDEDGEEYEDDVVTISDCEKSPCKLVRGNQYKVIFKFKPEADCNEVINNVSARIANADVPYIGVNGQKSCDKISKPDGSKAECPLKAGEEYIYTNEMVVHKIYPILATTVKWGLASESGDMIFCFKVKAQIAAH